jgi:hypothetical protein
MYFGTWQAANDGVLAIGQSRQESAVLAITIRKTTSASHSGNNARISEFPVSKFEAFHSKKKRSRNSISAETRRIGELGAL